jgi:hypothetical protein
MLGYTLFVMSVALIIGGLSIGGRLLCTWIMTTKLKRRGQTYKNFDEGFISIKTWAITVLCFATVSPFIYEFPHQKETLMSINLSGKVTAHPYGTFTLGSLDLYSNVPNKPISARHAPAVTLLTENPKVRKVQHNISVIIKDVEKFYSVKSRQDIWAGNDQDIEFREDMPVENITHCIQTLLNSHLYDFNNAHSKDLAKFYNPLDQSQQKDYLHLMFDCLDPILAQDGLEINSASFDIE